MSLNVFEKILEPHILEQNDNEVVFQVDQTLTQDATGCMSYLQLETLPTTQTKPKAYSYIDHNTIQQGYENTDDHTYLSSVAKKYGITFSRAGNGICHQLHLENAAAPKKTLLGSDSHTPTAGGIGMLAIGAGGLDVAAANAGEPYRIPRQKIREIHLTGSLPEHSSAKDVILEILYKLTTKGNVGWSIEYTGDIDTLTVPERATIANMGAELGVTTSVFPSDKVTKQFLKAQGRLNDWQQVEADRNAAYDDTLELDLTKIEPLVALPHSPDNVTPARKAKRRIQQVCIGSCTNSAYRDLMMAAKMLEGKTIAESTSLIITPGSRRVLQMLAENGALAIFLSAGARVTEPSCGFCIGACHAPGTQQASVRTSNRNFQGRSGTSDAGVYLTSVET
ncbi:MAG: aconitate hydratase, partial [Candidatus Altiarchaeales archaeon]|nr:aconitate hydratase [Candidatus Altiarchaeales archaeon]